VRITPVAVPLTLAALLVSCQDANESNTDILAPSSIPPSSSIVLRDRIEGGTLIHTIPEHGISMTVGLLTPVADLAECGGTVTEFESDAQIFSQEVHTPAGPIKALSRFSGTFTVYDAVVFPDDFCDMATTPLIGTGRGTIKGTDNSATGEGPGMNSYGENWTAVLDTPDGGKVQLHIVARKLYDGVDETIIVDIFELKPLKP
jgi:hypothetical protein